MLKGWFREGKALYFLKTISESLERIASALEEQNLSKGDRSGLGLRTFYSDKRSEEEADYQAPTDEYFAELELLEQAKLKQGGESADLEDEELRDLIQRNGG